MGVCCYCYAGAVLNFSLTAQFLAESKRRGIWQKNFRHSLFDHIQKLSYTQLDNQGTSTLITRMTSDVNLVQTSG
ncbi:MAG: hypothetical protein ACLUR5_12545 [Eubacterium ventriosum]